MEPMVWVWVAVFVIAVIVEAITQEFVSIWFAVGALVSLVTTFVIPDLIWAQVLIFSFVSLIALACTRPLVRKMTQRAVRHTNVDEFVGKRVKLEKAVTKYDAGEVKVNGIIYSAILMEDVEDTIEQDSIVEIVTLRGNKIVVKKLEE